MNVGNVGTLHASDPNSHHHLQITSFIDENYEWLCVQPFFALHNICFFPVKAWIYSRLQASILIGKHVKLGSYLISRQHFYFRLKATLSAGETLWFFVEHRDTSWSKRDIRVRRDRNYCFPPLLSYQITQARWQKHTCTIFNTLVNVTLLQGLL